MTVHTIQGRGYDSNIYVITGKHPTIIDTGTGQNQKHVQTCIEKIIDPKSLSQIILTHEHFDHVGGAEKILELTDHHASIFAHPKAQEKIEMGESMFARMLGSSMPKISIDGALEDNEKIVIGDDSYTVIYTPGHTPGCICLYSEEKKNLFSGDTVFPYGSFGRTDFPGGSTEELKESIRKLTTCDINDMYPGHEAVVQGDGNDHVARSYENICMMM